MKRIPTADELSKLFMYSASLTYASLLAHEPGAASLHPTMEVQLHALLEKEPATLLWPVIVNWERAEQKSGTRAGACCAC